MTQTDNRKLTPDAQLLLRKKVISAILNGMPKTQAVIHFGVSRAAIYKWIVSYEANGEEGLELKKRGPKNKKSKLEGWQAAQICNIIRDRHPEQLRLPFALWNARAVSDLIRKKYNIRFTIRYVQILLKRWGFTPQKPRRVAYEQNDEAVQQWLASDYPEIEKRAKAEKARIFWGDETGIRSDDQLGRTYAPKGQTPAVKASGKRFGCNMISALSNRGSLQFMIFKSRFVGKVFIKFLRRLVKDNTKKVFLVVDGHPVHKSKLVREWVKDHNEAIELFFLPPYSPELNPDEYLNNDLKTNAVRNKAPKDQKVLMRNVRKHMNRRRSEPHVVRAFFHAEPVRYAM